MRERLKTFHNLPQTAWIYGLLALFITFHYLLVYAERFLIWSGHEPVFNALRMLHALLIILLLLLLALMLRRGMAPEFWLLAAYSAWVLITRVINRDFTLYGSLYFSAVCAAVFAAGAFLRPQQRRRLLKCFVVPLDVYLFILSALGLLVWFGGEDRYPFLAAFINTNPFNSFLNIEFFNTVHNMSAAWFLVSLFLSAYAWTACRDRRWRIPLAIHMAMMYIMIALQHCRSVQVACSVGAGMLAVLALLPRLREQKAAVRVIAVILAAALGLLISFRGLSLCGDVFAKGMAISQRDIQEHERLLEEQRRAAAQTETVPPAEIAPAAVETAPPSGSDARSFLHDALTLTERTEIWKAAIRLVREDRSVALFGQREETMMEAVNSRGHYIEVKQHTHNMLIQALVLTGVPGALLLLAFVCLQLVRMIRYYFESDKKTETAVKVLLVLPAVLLVYGIAEVLLDRLVGFASLSYLLTAGIFTQYARRAS